MEEDKKSSAPGEPETGVSPPSPSRNSTDGTIGSEAGTGKEAVTEMAEQGLPIDDSPGKNTDAGEAGTANKQQPAQAWQEQQPQQTYRLPPGYVIDQTTGQIVFTTQVPRQPVQPGEEQTAQPAVQPQQQVQQPQQAWQLPPGYAIHQATGQIFFTGQAGQQPVQASYVQPGVVYTRPPEQQPSPEQVAARQEEAQQRYGQVINKVEKFIAGEATVADVVKTLYTNTSQDDQLWKGAIVGAAAAVLLTSEPVREVMGKTLGGVFPGLKKEK